MANLYKQFELSHSAEKEYQTWCKYVDPGCKTQSGKLGWKKKNWTCIGLISEIDLYLSISDTMQQGEVKLSSVYKKSIMHQSIRSILV